MSKQDSRAQPLPAKGFIEMISGGSSMDFENKRQDRDYFRLVNAVFVEGPIRKSKWSHIPITFTEADLDLKSYPHSDAYVIKAHKDKWRIDKVLIDSGSQADIIFHGTLLRMGYTDQGLDPSNTPLYGFDGKRVEPAGKIKLPVTFGDTSNPRTKFVTFDVVRLNYPYFAILGRPTTNTFEAAIHNAYLRMKIPAAKGVTTVKGDQQLARNIEKGFTLGIANIHSIQKITKEQPREKATKKTKIFNLDPSSAKTADEAEPIIWHKMSEGFAAAKDEIAKKYLSKKK